MNFTKYLLHVAIAYDTSVHIGVFLRYLQKMIMILYELWKDILTSRDQCEESRGAWITGSMCDESLLETLLDVKDL